MFQERDRHSQDSQAHFISRDLNTATGGETEEEVVSIEEYGQVSVSRFTALLGLTRD